MPVRRFPLSFAIAVILSVAAQGAEPLLFPGVEPLTLEGQIDSQLVAGVDRFLLRQIDASVENRERFWQREFSTHERYQDSLEPNRQRLRHILGLREQRVEFEGVEFVGTTAQPASIGRSERVQVFAIRWPVVGDITAEGLLLLPANGQIPVANIVAIPDADQTPEQIAGLAEGIAAGSQYARRLAESGCRVVVPTIISRARGQFEWSGRRPDLTNREFLYRSAFELGRHLIGYEVQKVLAAVDWFQQDTLGELPIGVIGWGEGGLLALYSAALDPRIDATLVSGYFEPRESLWQEPIDRNVFGLLEQFGDAELASMVAPRTLIIEAARGPELRLEGGPGAPARLRTPNMDRVRQEFRRAREIVAKLDPAPVLELVESEAGQGPFATDAALTKFLSGLSPALSLFPLTEELQLLRKRVDPNARMHRQMREIDRHTQWALRESPYVRKAFMGKLDTSSLENYEASAARYRQFFYDEVIGRFDLERLPPHPRARKAYDEEKWVGYEVVLDVFPDVIAYGLLLIPKDIEPGERRPVVVCQHGLEGRPQDLIGEPGHDAYKAYAARLAERGFVTLAPQNLYRFQDRFRTLQRKANPLKKTLFSIITPQHQQFVDWLKTLPFVDEERIGFYGLSYGGKTAMRVPAIVTDYCLSICSADFNEWVDKNASTRDPHSYVWTGEYEIFEFDLGSSFNYSEMAALIAPRPFMVERGHFDGVASDETVGFEFAKVRFLYQGRLKIGDRCRIEWFDGPHTINGKGTFDFLHEHLDWPASN